MQKNELYKCGDDLVRVLAVDGEQILIIDCVKPAMPRWVSTSSLKGWERCAEGEYPIPDAWRLKPQEEIMTEQRKLMHERYTLIAPVLPFIHKESMRSVIIAQVAEMNGVSKQTVRKYLCLYLASQKIESLAPGSLCTEKPLTPDEKNFRWALNRYFYTQRRHSLTTTYTLMLKDKYTDTAGQLVEGYPPFHRFRYYYQKTRNLQREIAGRESYTAYLRDYRPLLGDGVQEMAPAPGVCMLDSTVCDIYLIDDSGSIVGRPVLTACVDAFSGMCCGYSLGWEGGVYSLRGLMLNTISDKVQWCRERGVFIEPEQWPNCGLPGVMISDMGSEYISETFSSNIAELGVKVTSLPPARPDLKSRVEKFFDVVQQLYKNHLKWKGVVEPDYQKRGARNYSLDSTLTLQEFERVLLHCIVYYNFRRSAENYPYTEPMLEAKVKPNASSIFAWGLTQPGANFIDVTPEQVIMTLLPRTKARFTRKGLIVNGIRYRNDAYTEQYLRGGDAVAAYNPDDVSVVWLLEKGEYIPFKLIERRFSGKSLDGVKQMKAAQSELVRSAAEEELQAQIDLAQHIEVIANKQSSAVGIKNIRQTRQRARTQTHIDYVKEVQTHSAKKEVTNHE